MDQTFYKGPDGARYTITRDASVPGVCRWQVNRFTGAEQTETFYVNSWSDMIDFMFDKFIEDKEPAHHG